MTQQTRNFYQTEKTRYSSQVRPGYIKSIRNLVLNEVASILARIPAGKENEAKIDAVILSAIDRLDSLTKTTRSNPYTCTSLKAEPRQTQQNCGSHAPEK